MQENDVLCSLYEINDWEVFQLANLLVLACMNNDRL